MDNRRYPVGAFAPPGPLSASHRNELIDSLERLPEQVNSIAGKIGGGELNLRYRPEGWTIRQLLHHLPDSHLNGYLRFKWALTEDEPTIKVYEQERWAELADSRDTPVEVSIQLLTALHRRWVVLLKSMPDEAFARTLIHPEEGSLTLATLLALYEWHGRHHLGHVRLALEA